jgi:hypothetical protein
MADVAYSSSRVLLKAFTSGAVACLALYGAMKAMTILEADIGRYPKLGFFVLLFVAGGLAVGRYVRRSGHSQTWRLAATAFGAALLGIAGGVVFWNTLEELVFRRVGDFPVYQERTLFPVDVALLWMFGSLPLLTGIIIGVVTGEESRQSHGQRDSPSTQNQG